MTYLRPLLILLTALLVGLTPAAALQTPTNGGLTAVVICTGDTTTTITLDQNGNPVRGHHVCLDCCLSVALPGPAPDMARHLTTFFPTGYIETRASARFQTPPANPPSTGPPALI